MFLLILLAFSKLNAQDTEFYFVGYEPHYTPNATDKWGFLFSNPSTTTSATVTITFFNGKPTQTVTIPANTGYHFYPGHPSSTFTFDMLSNPRSTAGQVVNGGIYIKSTSPITAAVHMGLTYSQDIFTLKGKPALGKEFYVSQVSDGWSENASEQPGVWQDESRD